MSTAQQPTTTLFFGNLDPRVDRDILFEIGLQAGPITSVTIPLDQTSGKSKGFGFLVRTRLVSAC
jgi:splicing factor 3B subunit 4